MAEEPKLIIHNGRYSLFEEVGSGLYGEVWRGRDNVQDARVAVKLLSDHVELDAALLEPRLMERLRQHERIVTIRNVELAPPRAFIVMDYLPAGSVGDRLKMGVVSLVDAVRWTRDALDGLAYSHAEGVIHRDIKPANLLLDDEERAVLSDFGVAEDTVNSLLAVPHTYMRHQAPEQDSTGSSERSDIWAMGCTLYRLLTGVYPFETENDAAQGQFEDPHRLNAQVPIAITRVVRKALEVNPADRYPSARTMLRELMEPDVRSCWTLVSDPSAIECWAATTGNGSFVLRLNDKTRGGYEVAITRDRGNGPRHVVRESFPGSGDALRVRRNYLLKLVATGSVL